MIIIEGNRKAYMYLIISVDFKNFKTYTNVYNNLSLTAIEQCRNVFVYTKLFFNKFIN